MADAEVLPILPGVSAGRVIAWRGDAPVRAEAMLGHVLAVAAALPDAPTAINLCLDRYWFAVGFLACAARGIVTLMPSSNAPLHLAGLAADNPGVIALGDQVEPLMDGCPWWDLAVIAEGAEGSEGAEAVTLERQPQVPADQVVARFHTSGSTGVPKVCEKRWGLLQAGLRSAGDVIRAVTGEGAAVVGTSSFRHMFGFEATVMLPLWAGGSLTCGTPFFPADVAAALAASGRPPVLVSTPYHLRKMLEADIDFPRCAALLSATAPLSADLARAAEKRFGAPLLEVYGSTELGMLATRRTGESDVWRLLPGCAVASSEAGFMATGPSLASPQALHDLIEPLDGEVDGARFRLVDRSSNLINVVGKRSSLDFLNQVLQGLPGVLDGVFCVPPDVAHHDVTRLAAFVVAPGLKAADILAGLRPHVDAVFLPRPIVMLEALPRDANAKLPAAAMQALMAEHLQRKS